jgi:glycosyltransferase involved in cell wall biosynthesis
MNSSLLASIIINNYNYGQFLAHAIESALAQSYPLTEVLVVDDGSKDHSPAVIASFADRIVPILKENGGQASALNAGFARCRGDVVIFLDADDTLHPSVVERVVHCFQRNANVGRVQYRLAMVDSHGKPLGMSKPPQRSAIPSGDLQRQVLLYGDDLPWLPTSGNAFSREVLQKIFPIPESPYRICADYYLSNLSPLYGFVEALNEVGGSYRLHTTNHHEKDRLDLEQTRQMIIRTRQTHTYMYEHAKRLGLLAGSDGKPLNEIAALSMTFAANRLVSLRLAPAQHPITGDKRFGLARKGIWAAWRRPDLSLLLKCIYTMWFCLACVAPQSMLPWLAEELFYPQARDGWFHRFLSILRREEARSNQPVRAEP